MIGRGIVKRASWVVVVLVMVMSAFSAHAGHGHDGRAVKKGILLVAFGTSEASAQVSFTNIEARVTRAFPGVPVQWAYTSHIIRHKLAARGSLFPRPAQALARLMDDGFTDVAVQSLLSISGEEYDSLAGTIQAFRAMPDGFHSLTLGVPMLGTQGTVKKTVDAILANLPQERKPGEAVVLMGHGTPHPANVYYSALNWQLQLRDPDIMVGTVEGFPELDDVIRFLDNRKITSVWLIPFMSVAGDHAKNDLAGDGEDSWKSILTGKGIQCRVVLKGTAEFDAFVDIWLDNLKTAVAGL